MDDIFDRSDITVVIAPNELLVGNREQFKNYLLSQANGRHVLVDMKQCEYIDSSALGMLLNVSRELQKNGKNLGLFGFNGDFATLFEMTRIGRVIFVSAESKANLKALRSLREFQPQANTLDEDDDEYQPPDLKLI